MKNTIVDQGNLPVLDSKLDTLLPPSTKILCYIVAFFAVLAILSFTIVGMLAGAVLLCLCLALLTAERRITVDFENPQYKEYYSFLGMQTSGEWKKLITCSVITITNASKTFSNNLTMGGAQTYATSRSFQLHLKKDNYKKLTIANGSYEEIVAKAHIAAAALGNVDILDYTVKPTKKLND